MVFTIAARNYIPYACALHSSLKRFYADLTFVLALCDLDIGIDRGDFPFEVLTLSELRDTRVWGMVERYNASEFCTAIKPMVFKCLMDRHPGALIVYLDPDTWVTSRMMEIDELSTSNVQAILTPHILAPASRPELIADNAMLQFGIYNLGFLALRDNADTRILLKWWAHKLEKDCRIDLKAGLFVDQKWADLFPALLDRVAILRHPGYNVAYWNVLEREVRFGADRWQVNGVPLRLVHFSGHDLTRPELFSRNAEYLDRWAVGDLFLLQAEWRDAVLSSNYHKYSVFRYGFQFSIDDAVNQHTPIELADRIAADGTSAIGQSKERSDEIFFQSFTSWSEWEERRKGLEGLFAEHRAAERALVPATNSGFLVPGRCAMCRTNTDFVVSFAYAVHNAPDGRLIPNWREHLDCRCLFNNRIRGAVQALYSLIAPEPDARIFVTEQVTRLYGWLAARWPGLVGSEFLGSQYVSGQLIGGVRHEDLCRLSFADNSFDVVLSLDVLEHVENLRAALEECLRVLAPGGTLIFSAPTQFDRPEIIDRVVTGPDGELQFLAPPEYHGNPVGNGEGSLCFRYLGLNILDMLRTLGYVEARCEFYWSQEVGLLGPYQNVFIARKPVGAKRGRGSSSAVRKPASKGGSARKHVSTAYH